LNTLFVKINEASVAEAYGIEQRPSLVVFEQGIPNVYEGDLYDSDLGWKSVNYNGRFKARNYKSL
jgi:hypothetical protein